MQWFEGFPFKSKAQAEKERREFEKRIFPLGMQQREHARAVLNELFPEKKYENERLYAFISAKDRYTAEDMSDEALRFARGKMNELRWLAERDKDLIMALMLLDCQATSLEDYPTAQQVLERCQA